jgi:hypothetical protein
MGQFGLKKWGSLSEIFNKSYHRIIRLTGKLTFIFGLALILFSCSEVKKQVAIDDLVGTYYGKPVVVLQWTKLNIGLDDQIIDDEKSEFIIIIKDIKDNLNIKFDDGIQIRLNNINMAQNGAIFNIPDQKIRINSDGIIANGIISGLNENYFGESKCDGFYNSGNNKLSFSFAGTMRISENGEDYDVPIAVGYYDFIKQK